MPKPREESDKNVVFLFRKEAEIPHTPVNVDHLFVAEEKPVSREAAIDLTGKPKGLFLIGAGGTGKTTFARWVGERAYHQEVPPVFYLLSVDPLKRDLLDYHPNALQPDNGANPSMVVDYLERVFARMIEVKRSFAIDFGGGDTALLTLLRQTPDLHTILEDGGIEPIALHFLAPQTDSLVPLVAMERAGFRPRATALVLNCSKADLGSNVDDQFARVRAHPDYVRAVERGAVEVWYPRLKAAAAIQDRRVGFWAAMNQSTGANLNMFEHRQVRTWLEHMETNMAPIVSWLEP